MTRIITTIAFFICSLLTAQSQYEQGMGKALGLWKEGKANEASALMERIASVEKTNWLPSYYVALINTTEAFNPANKANAAALIEKAQKAQDDATMISPSNPELMVMQAMIYTAIIVQDPMTNGMKYSGLAREQYNKAIALAPNNPRVVFCRAEFEIGGARWTGADTKALCKEVARSIELFAADKPETPFSPSWGMDRAQQKLLECK
ncbi:hypothetical protein [Flavobacterium sp.]|jgi:hypothetical protein|uniref:hypothetical protein n=1 Tax=Flavobacterium sp. TaxID=239 RepID=UPI0035B2325F